MTSNYCGASPAKKAKRAWRSWEGELEANGKRFGLKDLFSQSGFTLRLEHRQGGSLAKHRGEERILLFRSDKGKTDSMPSFINFSRVQSL